MLSKEGTDVSISIYGWDLAEQPDLSNGAYISGSGDHITLSYETFMTDVTSGEIPDAAFELPSDVRQINGNLDGTWGIDWDRCYVSTEGKFYCSITRQVPAS